MLDLNYAINTHKDFPSTIKKAVLLYHKNFDKKLHTCRYSISCFGQNQAKQVTDIFNSKFSFCNGITEIRKIKKVK